MVAPSRQSFMVAPSPKLAITLYPFISSIRCTITRINESSSNPIGLGWEYN